MPEIGMTAGLCLVVLAAWFLLRIELAEALLILMLLSVAAAGGYWFWSEGWSTEIAAAVGIFTLLVVILGSLRLGIEKLSDLLAAHSKVCASALGFRPADRSGRRTRA